MTRLLLAIVALLAFLPGLAIGAPAQAPATPAPPLILISIDGFRWDYLDRGLSPHLAALASDGVRAERMIPSWPSITFPNHYTLVTGLYPDHHGIVANGFVDPAMPGPFTMGSHEPAWWEGATPLWVTAAQHGLQTGVMFWPGSEAAIHGIRPDHWVPFDHSLPAWARVDKVLGWLDLPAEQRPRFLTLYFDAVDGAGHHFGPDSPEVNAAIADTDQAIGRLTDGLKARGIAANLVIVADHGMAAVPAGHVMLLDRLIDMNAVKVVFDDAVLGVDIPDTAAGHRAEATLLAAHDHLQCWRKQDIPARLHYGTNRRVPDVVCMVATGWLMDTGDDVARHAARHDTPERGAHGFDNADPLMGALFIADGPAFRQGLVVAPFPNVDVYPLMATVLGLPPEPNDGHLADVAPILR